MNAFLLVVQLHVQVTGGIVIVFGPAILLQAYRFIVDSRDKNKKKE